ncbi:PhnD/SsuA/transferrin family substrate-binding protein [Oscillospiraceae bacterium OttesenSCG-928-G22]|nr:PhnD/SsuA/transferrin family substrate-binding protein [Oscillospiraceae bacterium OttesenSCG-928-G22]
MKRICLVFVAALLAVSLIACAPNASDASDPPPATSAPAATDAPSATKTPAPDDRPQVRLGALTGPTMFGFAPLLTESAQGATENNYTLETLAGTADELTAGLAKGTLDIAAIPANLASVIYNNTNGGIRLLSTVNLGVLYIVETGDSIQSIEDLRGKTIYATGKGTTPEMTLNYILTQNGLDPSADLTVEYKSEAAEVAAVLAKGEGIAMLPQPFVTAAMAKNDSLRIALDLTEEWDRVSDGKGSVVTGVVVGRTEFVEENPEAVAAFFTEYEASSNFVNDEPDVAAAYIARYNIVPEEVAKAAIPYLNIRYIDGVEMKEIVSGYLSVLFEMNPKSVGGALPDDDFYFAK